MILFSKCGDRHAHVMGVVSGISVVMLSAATITAGKMSALRCLMLSAKKEPRNTPKEIGDAVDAAGRKE